MVVPFSRIFDLSDDGAKQWDDPDFAAGALAEALSLPARGETALDGVVVPNPQNISLNVSSSCNLACSYCYAARGNFEGVQSAPMTWEVAKAATDRLLHVAVPTAPIVIGFLGGEPFVNRALIHQVVAYASDKGRELGLDVRFSVTTNGTLLEAKDVRLLQTHPFAVTISIDGSADLQDRARPFAGRNAHSSFEQLRQATVALVANPGRSKLAARATVTSTHLDLIERFNAILALGFSEIGFAPLRVSSNGGGTLRDEHWDPYQAALTSLARAELARALNGGDIRLTNLAVALKQLYRGAASPYPCGAGGGYFSVATTGDWYACHRAIGKEAYRVGDSSGLDEEKRRAFLVARHVHTQTDCRACWARYLCSGGCHQEASTRDAANCNFIRGWLRFCLEAYCELSERRPEYFCSANHAQ